MILFEELPDRIQSEMSSSPKLSNETFVLLRDFIYEKTGIYFNEKKKYLVEGRIAKRLKMLKMVHFEEYVHLLKYGKQKELEFEFLCNTITINETSFFRTESQVLAFHQKLAVEVITAKKASGLRSLRIWSAACASGEEPYTLAMLYLEHLKPLFPDLRIEIIGTDISTSVLHIAKTGEYNQYAVRTTPELYKKKYFTLNNGIYQLHENVKELVQFQYHNLIDRNMMRRMSNFDFIFCENVLIYFDQKSKIQVIGDIYNSLNRGGYLFIGTSEMLHGISNAFKVVGLHKTTAYKKE